MAGRLPNSVPRQGPGGEQLSTAAPGVNIDPGIASSGGRSLQTLGAGVQDVGQQLSKAFTLAEQTHAENFLGKQLATIEDTASKDPDYSPDKEKQYHEQISKAQEEASNMVSLPFAKSLFQSDADKAGEISKIRINGSFLKKTVDSAKAGLTTYLDMQKNVFVTARSPLEKENAILQRDSKIDAMANTGFIPRDSAAEMKVKLNTEWNNAHLNYDIETNPGFAVEELKKGDAGYYKSVDPDVRVKALETGEKRVDFLSKKATEDTEDQLMKFDALKMLTPDMVEQAALTGTISKSFYRAVKGKFLSSIGPQANTNKTAYMGIVNTLLNPNVDPGQARIKLLEESAKGNISPDDFKSLYQMHLTPAPAGQRQSLSDMIGSQQQVETDFEKAVSESQQKKAALTDKRSFLSSAVSFLQNMAGKNTMMAADMVKGLYGQIQSGQTAPEEYAGIARKVLSREILKARPDITSAPKGGKVLIDAYGNKMRVFPDGTYQEEK